MTCRTSEVVVLLMGRVVRVWKSVIRSPKVVVILDAWPDLWEAQTAT